MPAFAGRTRAKIFTRLGSNSEASRRVALDSVLFGGAVLPSRRERVGRFLCPGDSSRNGTTQQHNTHITDAHDIYYSWHPWHGRAVRVHASLLKRGQAVTHCSLEDVQACRTLEVPLWMLDVAACCKTRASKPGFASAQSLRDLKEVL